MTLLPCGHCRATGSHSFKVNERCPKHGSEWRPPLESCQMCMRPQGKYGVKVVHVQSPDGQWWSQCEGGCCSHDAEPCPICEPNGRP